MSANKANKTNKLKRKKECGEKENGLIEDTYLNAPRVVIVGRPNTGKSTLFNRFLNRRVSLVNNTAGVTRDIVHKTCLIQGQVVELYDTAGYTYTKKEDKDKDLTLTLNAKTLEVVKEASLILFILEAGIFTSEDDALLKTLRPYSDKCLYVVNKCEGGRGEATSYDFMRYGIKDLNFISSAHGDNISTLAALIVSKLDFSRVEKKEVPPPIRLLLLGKPNTGKSSLFNLLAKRYGEGKDNYFALVEDKAGTTRDALTLPFNYKNKSFTITDTAGVRKRARVRDNVEYYGVNRAIKEIKKTDIVLFLLEATEGITEQDKKLSALCYDKGVPVLYLLNKWDKMEDRSDKAFKKIKERLLFLFGLASYSPFMTLSALTGEGLEDILNCAIKTHKMLYTKFDTNVINRAIKEVVTSLPPRSFKVKYAVQTRVHPVTFLLFVVKSQNISASYAKYIENKLRVLLGLSYIPLKIEFKLSRKNWEERVKEKSD